MPQENSQNDMGKKIADALKAQNDLDFEITEDLTSDDVLTDLDDLGLDDDSNSQEDEQESFTAENFDFDTEVEKGSNEFEYSSQDEPSSIEEDDEIGYEPIFKVNQQQAEEHAELKLSIDAEESTDEFEMPNNINVLKNLVAKLPSGVPRQTGLERSLAKSGGLHRFKRFQFKRRQHIRIFKQQLTFGILSSDTLLKRMDNQYLFTR